MAAPLGSVHVFPLPLPPSDDHVAKYKAIRLAGLKTNPEAFGSTYEIESAFPPDKWATRVNTPGRTTLIATALPPNLSPTITAEDRGEWVGTLSILSPEMLCAIAYEVPLPSALAAEQREFDLYALVGMWVHPEHRGKGVGSSLVRCALDVVRGVPSFQAEGQSAGSPLGGVAHDHVKGRVLILEVHKHNCVARKLYESTGFIPDDPAEPEGEDRDQMYVVL